MASRPLDRPHVRIARNCLVRESDAHDLVPCCLAALRSSAPETVIASVTAGLLHRLWLPTDAGPIHLATATAAVPGRSMTRTKRPQCVAHRYQLEPDDIVEVDGLPVTSVARTWRDLAAVLTLPELVAAGDSALRAGTRTEQLALALDRGGPARRSRVARHALTLLDVRSRSRPESHLRVAVWAPGLPRFEVNEPVYRDEGGWLAEPDLSLAEAKIALEYQGADHADVRRMRKDLTRGADLRDDGWLVLAYGPAEVFGRPHVITAEVRREVGVRAPQLVRRSRAAGGRPGHRVAS